MFQVRMKKEKLLFHHNGYTLHQRHTSDDLQCIMIIFWNTDRLVRGRDRFNGDEYRRKESSFRTHHVAFPKRNTLWNIM
jgi:hypothetical protein